MAELHAGGCKRESIRKTLSTLAQVLDFAKVEPNPVRDDAVKLPREAREPKPPDAEHVAAVVRSSPPLTNCAIVLDASGMRVGELDSLTWGDVDELNGRWRVSAAVAKSERLAGSRSLRRLQGRHEPRGARGSHGYAARLPGFGSDRFRTALARACRTAGVPTFSPHDLRHRRISLLHEHGVSWARIGEAVGHGDIVTTARTYTHVIEDEEVDYEEVLA